jgi:hypothetical protein
MAGKTESGEGRCGHCRHFRNSPAYIEETFKGLTSLSSGYASVRHNDGICEEHGIYLSAMGACEQFSPRAAEADGAAAS